MPAKITNQSIESISLPYPFAGVLGGGKSVILNFTAAQLSAMIPEVGVTGVLQFTDLPTYTGPYDTDFMASADRPVSVANKAALGLLNGALIDDHTPVFVETYRQPWILEKTSTAALRAHRVIDAVGGGRWHRDVTYAHPLNKGQLNWDYDAVVGDDENSGVALSGFPIKTLDELIYRLGEVDAGQSYVCNILSPTVPATDLFVYRPKMTPGIAGTGGFLRFLGLRTVMALGSGAFTATTATVGNVQATVTGPAVWANFLGRHIRMTSGAANGAVAVILEDLGAGAAEVSEWSNESTGVLTATPSALDTYEIVSETSWLAPIQIFSRDVQGLDVEFQNVSIDTGSFKGHDNTTLRGCRTTVALSGSASFGDLAKCVFRNHAWYFAAISNGGGLFTGAFAEFIGGGAVNTRFGVTLSSSFRISNFVMNRSTFQTWGPTTTTIIVPNGVVNLNGGTKWGIHRSPAATPGLNLLRGLTACIGGTLYGQLNSIACKVAEGASMQIKTGITPTVTGTVELNYDDQVTVIPDITASGGGTLPVAVPITTFAQWVTAGRNVTLGKSGAKIINVA